MTAVRNYGPSAWPARGVRAEGHVLALMAMLAVAVSLALAVNPELGVLAFGLLVILVATALSPELALGSILVSALLMLGLQSYFNLPSQALLLTRVLIGLFALSALLRLRQARRVHSHLAALIAWTVVLTISALFGVSAGLLSLQSLWAYVCGPIALVAILYSGLSLRSLRRLSLVVGLIIVAELPIVLFERLFLAERVDQIGGTFGMAGGTAILAVVMGFAWTVSIAMLTDRARVWLIPIAVGIATLLFVCEAKAGFIFCAVATVAVGFTRGALTRRFATVSLQYIATAIASVAALFAAFAYAGDLFKGGQRAAAVQLANISNPRFILRYLFSYGPQGQAGRLEGVRLALSRGRPPLADILLGRGPGLLSTSKLTGDSSTFLTQTGTLFNWATSLTRSILETGVLGTLLYVCVVGFAVWTVASLWRPRTDVLAVSVLSAAVGLASVYILAGTYSLAWYTDAVAILFWCLLGMAAKWGQLRFEEQGGSGSGAITTEPSEI